MDNKNLIKETDSFQEFCFNIYPFKDFIYSLFYFKQSGKFAVLMNEKESLIYKTFVKDIILTQNKFVKEFETKQEYITWKEKIQDLFEKEEENIQKNYWYSYEYEAVIEQITNNKLQVYTEGIDEKEFYIKNLSLFDSDKSIFNSYIDNQENNIKLKDWENILYKKLIEKIIALSKNTSLLLNAISLDEIDAIIWENQVNELEIQYSNFSIKKKSGKERKIQKPSKELKYLQKNLLKLLSIFEPSIYSYWYRKWYSAIDNAKEHLWQNYFVKLDLSSFFSSITFDMIFNLFFNKLGLKKDFAYFLAYSCSYIYKYQSWNKLVMTKNNSLQHQHATTTISYLPSGSSTSPLISNLIFSEIDEIIWSYLQEKSNILFWNNYQIKYTRYSDDITISFPEIIENKEILNEIILSIEQIIGDKGFHLNNEKTKYLTLKDKVEITGIPIQSWDMKIFRKKRISIKTVLDQLEYWLLEYEKIWSSWLYKKIIVKSLLENRKISIKLLNRIISKGFYEELNKLFYLWLEGEIMFISSVNKEDWNKLIEKFNNIIEKRNIFYSKIWFLWFQSLKEKNKIEKFKEDITTKINKRSTTLV